MSYNLPPDFLNPPPGTIEEALISRVRAELGDRGIIALLYLRANLASAPRGVFVIDRKRFQDETMMIRSRLNTFLNILFDLFSNDFSMTIDDSKRRLEINWHSFTNQRRFIRQSTTDEPRINDGSSVNEPRMNGAGELLNNGGENEKTEKDQRARAHARAFSSSFLNKNKKKKEEDPTECQSEPQTVDLETEQSDLKFSGSESRVTESKATHRDKTSAIHVITEGDLPLIEAISQGRA